MVWKPLRQRGSKPKLSVWAQKQTSRDCPKEFADQIDGSHLTLQIEPLVSTPQNNLERIYRQEEKDVDEVLSFALIPFPFCMVLV